MSSSSSAPATDDDAERVVHVPYVRAADWKFQPEISILKPGGDPLCDWYRVHVVKMLPLPPVDKEAAASANPPPPVFLADVLVRDQWKRDVPPWAIDLRTVRWNFVPDGPANPERWPDEEHERLAAMDAETRAAHDAHEKEKLMLGLRCMLESEHLPRERIVHHKWADKPGFWARILGESEKGTQILYDDGTMEYDYPMSAADWAAVRQEEKEEKKKKKKGGAATKTRKQKRKRQEEEDDADDEEEDEGGVEEAAQQTSPRRGRAAITDVEVDDVVMVLWTPTKQEYEAKVVKRHGDGRIDVLYTASGSDEVKISCTRITKVVSRAGGGARSG